MGLKNLERGEPFEFTVMGLTKNVSIAATSASAMLCYSNRTSGRTSQSSAGPVGVESIGEWSAFRQTMLFGFIEMLREPLPSHTPPIEVVRISGLAGN